MEENLSAKANGQAKDQKQKDKSQDQLTTMREVEKFQIGDGTSTRGQTAGKGHATTKGDAMKATSKGRIP